MNNDIFELIKSDLIEANGSVAKAACEAYNIVLADIENKTVSLYGNMLDKDDAYIKIFDYFPYVYAGIMTDGLTVLFSPLHFKWWQFLENTKSPFVQISPCIIESQNSTLI